MGSGSLTTSSPQIRITTNSPDRKHRVLTPESDLAGCNGNSELVELRESNESTRQTGQSEIAGERRR
jgi:hypothetical protein